MTTLRSLRRRSDPGPRENPQLPSPGPPSDDHDELRLEMKYAIQFLVRIHWTPTDIQKKISEVYGEHSLSRSQIFKLISRCNEGGSATARNPGSGRPISVTNDENISQIEGLIRADRRITVRDIADELELSLEQTNYIIREELGFRKCRAAWVPKNLTATQLQKRVDLCKSNLEKINRNKHFLDTVITCDETWVYYEDPPARDEALHYRHSDSPIDAVAKRGLTPKKRLMLTFFGINGLICTSFLPQGHTMDSITYVDIISRRVLPKIREKRPGLIGENGLSLWTLHQDNARPHVAEFTKTWLASKGISLMDHPPYSPDLAPCDFWLFPHLKRDLRGIEFETESELKTFSLGSLNALPKEAFKSCYESWVTRMKRCIDAKGHYF